MKLQNFKKLPTVCAVSAALLGPAIVHADEFDEQLAAVKLSTYQEQLLVNTMYQEGTQTYVDAQLLTRVDNLPAECDPLSAFPVAEEHVDNPADELVGDWQVQEFDDLEEDDSDDDLDEDDSDDDDSDDDGDDSDDDGDDSDDDGDDSDDDGDDSDDDGDDSDDDGDDSDDDGDDSDDDGDDSDDDGDDSEDDGDDSEGSMDEDDFDEGFEGDFDGYLTVTPSGYLVSSEVETVDGVATCQVTFIGEVDGDTFIPTAN